MPKDYHHLTYDDRCQIHTLKNNRESQSTIAKRLGVHKSTISCELRRNSSQNGYDAKQAHESAQERRSPASRAPKKMTPDVIEVINECLQNQWSPQQISGRMKLRKRAVTVSHETIYKHIWRDKRQGGTLYKHLRHSGKKYNKRSSGKAGRGCIPNRVDIKERPKIVEEKSRTGDWEIDTIIGKGHCGAIVSMVDRASKMTKLVKVDRKTADNTEKALLSKLTPIKEFVITLTADNGKEFANHEKIAQQLQAGFFFATPYHSWERGLNEHTNGLVRQYLPKTLAFDTLTQETLDDIEILLNNRPRKVLNFMTPIEVFEGLTVQANKKGSCAA